MTMQTTTTFFDLAQALDDTNGYVTLEDYNIHTLIQRSIRQISSRKKETFIQIERYNYETLTGTFEYSTASQLFDVYRRLRYWYSDEELQALYTSTMQVK